MLQSSPFSRAFVFKARPALAVIGLVTVADAARAHTFSLIRGTAVVHPDRVVVELRTVADDLDHLYPMQPDDQGRIATTLLRNTVAAHKAYLLASLVIRGAAGERLPGRVVSTQCNAPSRDSLDFHELADIMITHRFEYVTQRRPRYLTFQFLERPDAGLRAQVVLAVEAAGERPRRTLRLTNGGNVETLEFAWDHGETGSGSASPAHPRPCAQARGDHGRLNALQAIVRVEPDGVQIDVVVPLPILETWIAVPRADRDFLEVAEQAAVRNRLREFLRGRNEVRIDGDPVSPVIAELRFLDLDAGTIDEGGSPRRLSAWTARVGVRLRYEAHSAPQQVEVLWGLFNNAVLSADAVVVVDGGCFEHRFSTYDRRFVWDGSHP
jgi:hypothetical protein